MRPSRLCFLSHFIICLGIAGAGFFAYLNGVPQAIFLADQSMMTSAIAALFLVSAIFLGLQAWRTAPDGPAYGHFAIRLSVMAGIVGTAIGLSLQARSLIGGSAEFLPLATSLYTTVTGATSAILLEVLTFNLEAGIARAEG